MMLPISMKWVKLFKKKSHIYLEGPVKMFTETAKDIKYSVNLKYMNTPKTTHIKVLSLLLN